MTKIIVERIEGHRKPAPMLTLEVDEKDAAALTAARKQASEYATGLEKAAGDPPQYEITVEEIKTPATTTKGDK